MQDLYKNGNGKDIKSYIRFQTQKMYTNSIHENSTKTSRVQGIGVRKRLGCVNGILWFVTSLYTVIKNLFIGIDYQFILHKSAFHTEKGRKDDKLVLCMYTKHACQTTIMHRHLTLQLQVQWEWTQGEWHIDILTHSSCKNYVCLLAIWHVMKTLQIQRKYISSLMIMWHKIQCLYLITRASIFGFTIINSIF